MLELSAFTHFLNRREIAAFMMNARQTVAHELLRDVRDSVAISLRDLLGREGLAFADAAHCVARAVGDAAIELAIGVAIERAARRVRRVLRDAGHLERFA